MNLVIALLGVGVALGALSRDRFVAVRGGFVGAAVAAVAQVAPGGDYAAAQLASGVMFAWSTVALLVGVMFGCLVPKRGGALTGAALAVGALLGASAVVAGQVTMPMPIVDADGAIVQVVAGWVVEPRAWARAVVWRASPAWSTALVGVACLGLVAAFFVPERAGRVRAVAGVTASGAALVAVGLLLSGVGAPDAVPTDLPPPSGAGAMAGSPFAVGGTLPLTFGVPVGLVAAVAGAVVLVLAAFVPREADVDGSADATHLVATAAGVGASMVATLIGVTAADPGWWSDPVVGGVLVLTLLVGGLGWMGGCRGHGRERTAALVALLIGIALTRLSAIA